MPIPSLFSQAELAALQNNKDLPLFGGSLVVSDSSRKEDTLDMFGDTPEQKRARIYDWKRAQKDAREGLDSWNELTTKCPLEFGA